VPWARPAGDGGNLREGAGLSSKNLKPEEKSRRFYRTEIKASLQI
jgi:hypothetical protein